MGFQIRFKKLEFIVDTSSISSDITFFTDENRLTQVLLNLVSNALKFTMKGYIKIEVASNDMDEILFKIEDTGIGMDENE